MSVEVIGVIENRKGYIANNILPMITKRYDIIYILISHLNTAFPAPSTY